MGIFPPSCGFPGCIYSVPWFLVFSRLIPAKPGKYALAGTLVAWSVLQSCNGLRCLSEEGYNLCRGVAVYKVIAIEAIADMGMKKVLEDIEVSTSEKEFADVIEKSADQIPGYGYSKIDTAKLPNKDEMVHSLVKQHFAYGVNMEFVQFIVGINTVGNFGDLVSWQISHSLIIS